MASDCIFVAIASSPVATVPWIFSSCSRAWVRSIFLGWHGPLGDHRDGIVADLDKSTFDKHAPYGIGRPALLAGNPHLASPEAADEGRMATSDAPLAVKQRQRDGACPRVEARHFGRHDDTANADSITISPCSRSSCLGHHLSF